MIFHVLKMAGARVVIVALMATSMVVAVSGSARSEVDPLCCDTASSQCHSEPCVSCVSGENPSCQTDAWDGECVAIAGEACAGACRCGVCLPSAGTCALAPVSDTYIQCDNQKNWSHGTAKELAVDANPRAIAYFKFDLSGIDEFVNRAVLRLRQGDDTTDDLGEVFPVPNVGWVEGSCAGQDPTCAGKVGLKCTDVDTQSPIGEITSDEPYAPDLSDPLGHLSFVSNLVTEADVTAAEFGTGIYSLAVRNKSMDRAVYVSRDDPRAELRPKLILHLGSSVCGNGIIERGEVCETNESCCAANCQIAASGTVCRPASGVCDVPETCDGATRTCPADAKADSTVVCRQAPSPTLCDPPEHCDGTRDECPQDEVAPPDTQCRTDDPCEIDQRCIDGRCRGVRVCSIASPQKLTVTRLQDRTSPLLVVNCQSPESQAGPEGTCRVQAFLADPGSFGCEGKPFAGKTVGFNASGAAVVRLRIRANRAARDAVRDLARQQPVFATACITLRLPSGESIPVTQPMQLVSPCPGELRSKRLTGPNASVCVILNGPLLPETAVKN